MKKSKSNRECVSHPIHYLPTPQTNPWDMWDNPIIQSVRIKVLIDELLWEESVLLWLIKYVKHMQLCVPARAFENPSHPYLSIFKNSYYCWTCFSWSVFSFLQATWGHGFVSPSPFSFHHSLFGHVCFRDQVSRMLLVHYVGQCDHPAALTQFYLCASCQQLHMHVCVCFEIDWLRWGIRASCQFLAPAGPLMGSVKVLMYQTVQYGTEFSNSELSIVWSGICALPHYVIYLWM